jgi:hypothetical protein
MALLRKKFLPTARVTANGTSTAIEMMQGSPYEMPTVAYVNARSS